MIATLTGLGLSSASGLNAYIPLLLVGLLARFTDLVPLGSAWSWLEHPVTLVCLTVLLVVEFAADKVPAVDSLNDAVQTVVRPSAGGITFGAGATSVELSELGAATAGDGVDWSAVLAGVVVALVFHVLKAVSRPVVNTLTGGAGGPVVSVVEDVVSAVTAVLAILLPILILVVFPGMVLAGVWAVRRRRRLRGRRRGECAAEPDVT
ncbi:DUF4126 domain-containing protein [Nocardiopsis sp. FIRDI 009]|uniref:DUF4126 domain-containing protein n=1 Tax=Nocardiopsis sp. FIRDI 009 TaxID=714197 RepID=UPI000E24A305|nr:DUF4126 domain-containing protein [Nocardiopsis sp. FIRDI 009]